MQVRKLRSLAVAGAIAAATLMLATPANAMPISDFSRMCRLAGGEWGAVPHYDFDLAGNAEVTGVATFCNTSDGIIWNDDE